MARAEPAARLAVEVLVEQQIVAPVGGLLEARVRVEYRPAAIGRTPEDADEALRQQVSDRAQRQQLARTSRALHQEVVAVVAVVFLQRLDQQVIDREPDRAAPVGVAAKYA